MPCAVCGEIGGQMVKLGEDSYRHASNCAPGVQYYDPRTKHKFSNAAKLFHKSSPEWLTLWVSDKMGYTSEEMATVGADGKRNEGEIVGYTWRKTK